MIDGQIGSRHKKAKNLKEYNPPKHCGKS